MNDKEEIEFPSVGIDTWTFTESLDYFIRETDKIYPQFQGEFKKRFREIQNKSSETSDLRRIEYLHETSKFYELTARLIDLLTYSLKYTHDNLQKIDACYWDAVLHHKQLKRKYAIMEHGLRHMKLRDKIMLAMEYPELFKGETV